MRKSWLKKIKALDFFPKLQDDAKETSAVGATISIIGGIVLILLLFSEIGDYLTPTRKDVLSVNYSSNEKMKIRFKVIFFELPCDELNIDVMDRFGDEHVGVDSKSFQKQAWKGKFEDAKLESGIGKGTIYADLLWRNLLKKAFPGRGCQPCPPPTARSGTRCCNTCQQLKKAFLLAGMSEDEAFKYPQCQYVITEGCALTGYIEVNKVQGSFHIAVGESHVEDGKKHHHHWAKAERKLGFNTSHYISSLAFGEDFPNMQNPLDEHLFVETGIGQQQYFIQVVPTTYQKANGDIIETNQYSATYHHNIIDLDSDHLELPGVFFKYDISEVEIHITESSKSFGHFVTRVCAVIGGMWVVIGLVYSVVNNLASAVATAAKTK